MTESTETEDFPLILSMPGQPGGNYPTKKGYQGNYPGRRFLLGNHLIHRFECAGESGTPHSSYCRLRKVRGHDTTFHPVLDVLARSLITGEHIVAYDPGHNATRAVLLATDFLDVSDF